MEGESMCQERRVGGIDGGGRVAGGGVLVVGE